MKESVWSLIGMLAVTGLILLLAYWATRYLASGGGTGARGGWFPGGGTAAGSGSFRVAGQAALGRTERLVLIRLKKSWCLIGVTEQSITLLKEWEAEEDWEPEENAPPDFWQVFRKTLGGEKGKTQ